MVTHYSGIGFEYPTNNAIRNKLITIKKCCLFLLTIAKKRLSDNIFSREEAKRRMQNYYPALSIGWLVED